MKNINSGKTDIKRIFKLSVIFLSVIAAVTALLIAVNITTGIQKQAENSSAFKSFMIGIQYSAFSAEGFINNRLSKRNYNPDNTSYTDNFCYIDRQRADLQNNDPICINELKNDLEAKDREIESLNYRINMLNANKMVSTAGIGSITGDILLMLLFAAAASFVSAYIMKRKTRSLCHCNNRRLKQLKNRKTPLNN